VTGPPGLLVPDVCEFNQTRGSSLSGPMEPRSRQALGQPPATGRAELQRAKEKDHSDVTNFIVRYFHVVLIAVAILFNVRLVCYL
jgi:hypothetical protein